MDHAEAQARWDDYFASRLSREEVRAFHDHLKDCEDCQAAIRIRRAGLRVRRSTDLDGGGPGDLQAQLARNRALLWRLLLLLFAAALVWRLKR
jgi:hypothetical protein